MRRRRRMKGGRVARLLSVLQQGEDLERGELNVNEEENGGRMEDGEGKHSSGEDRQRYD